MPQDPEYKAAGFQHLEFEPRNQTDADGQVQMIHLRTVDSQRDQPSDAAIMAWLRTYRPEYVAVAIETLSRR